MDRQRASKLLRPVEGQGELPLIRRVDAPLVAAEVIRSQRDMLSAFNLAVNVSGLDEKEIYLALSIDAGHWSRIRKGEAHFPLNKLEELCDLIGNEILLDYFAWKRRKGLHMLETEAERQLREAHDQLDREREKSKLLAELLQGRAA